MHRDPHQLHLDLSPPMDDEDLEQLDGEAGELAWTYHLRERTLVASVLSDVAGMARAELDDRPRRRGWGESVSYPCPSGFDPTANTEHNKDDLGTLMAIAMRQAERQDISDWLAHFWFGIVRQLARERDRLRKVGVIL